MGLARVIFNSPNQLKFLDRSLTPFPQRESIRSSIAKGTAEVAVSSDEQRKNTPMIKCSTHFRLNMRQANWIN